MKKFVLKKILFVFLVTGLWLFTPVYFISYPILSTEYNDLSKELTPSSVDVEGYHRSDGVYVRPYSRRPPGSVKKDRPIESEMSQISTFMTIVSIGFYGSLGAFAVGLLSIYKTSKNEYHQYLFDQVVNQLEIDFDYLKNKPSHLINRKISRHNRYAKIYNCIRCGRKIGYYEFNWSTLAKRKPGKICLDCMKSEATECFMNELEYVNKYNEKLDQYFAEFKIKCHEMDSSYSFDDNEIENYFNSKLIEARNAKN